jgi:hypothetical protein
LAGDICSMLKTARSRNIRNRAMKGVTKPPNLYPLKGEEYGLLLYFFGGWF